PDESGEGLSGRSARGFGAVESAGPRITTGGCRHRRRRRMGLNARVATLPGHEITVEEQQEFRVDDLLPSRVMRPADGQDAARGLRLCDLRSEERRVGN